MKVIMGSVDIVKRRVKGKMVFECVGIVLNYGFMRMGSEKGLWRGFLNKVKGNMWGIRRFVKCSERMEERKKKVGIDNGEELDDFWLVGSCCRKDVRRLIRLGKGNKKYCVDDVMNVKGGDYMVLKGYGYEGIDGRVLDVN